MHWNVRQGWLAFAGILWLLAAGPATAEVQPNALVTYKKGDLPIILSAPHGGTEAIPGAPERTGANAKRFVRARDMNTDKLAALIADKLETKLGKRPYVIAAKFHRKYLDANRAAKDAYESDPAKVVYDAYHKAIKDARADVTRRFGRGVLFDVHGQVKHRDAVLRGTQNGKTVRHLIQRYGAEANIGKTSLFGALAAQGVPILPKVDSKDREVSGYSGGYIVVAHGSADGGTIDAIQLEFGRALRETNVLPATAQKIANAIQAFAEKYLPKVALQPVGAQ